MRHNVFLRLALIAAFAILVHGYHLGVDDAAIYVPGIKMAADSALYPFGSEFFMSHANLSFFPNMVAASARLTHVPINGVILIWHAAGVFLLLFAAWRLACACFQNNSARWCAVAVVAGVLSVPVAGTALAIMDPYLTARSLSTPATILAIACFVSGQRWRAAAWLLFTGLIHPQMVAYCCVFFGCLALWGRPRAIPATAPGMLALSALPFLFAWGPAQGAAREALYSRTYFFVFQWEWYEWVGILAPLCLLAWFARWSPRGASPAFRGVSRALIPFGLMFTAAGIVLGLSRNLENYTRLQPMRAFHLLYVILFVLVGGLLGEYVLRKRAERWLGIFLPLAASMWILQWSSFPSSAHVEWPGSPDRNAWTSAFYWIRDHTPKDAVFALDPNYMHSAGEDQHGFRALAERSVLADNLKDSGAVSLFPGLAVHWKEQVLAQTGWEHFQPVDFERLATAYPVTWVVIGLNGSATLECPYRNQELAVCRIRAGSVPVAR